MTTKQFIIAIIASVVITGIGLADCYAAAIFVHTGAHPGLAQWTGAVIAFLGVCGMLSALGKLNGKTPDDK